MHVFFPSIIMEADTTTDCHLYYEPIGRDCRLANLDYVQPKFVTDKSASATATISLPNLQLQSTQMTTLLIFPPLHTTGQNVFILPNIHH